MNLELFFKAMSFFERMEEYCIDISYLDICSKEEKENYSKIVDRLKHIDLPDPESFVYSNLSFKQIIEMTNEILNKIFDNRLSKKIKRLSNKVKLTKFDKSNGGNILFQTSILGNRIKRIELGDSLYNIEIVTLAHEYMHALLSKYVIDKYDDVIVNYHYNELISMLMEYIVAYEINKIFKNEDLEFKHSIDRLDTLKRELILLENSRTEFAFDEVVSYIQHESYGYRISDIYVTKLLELYKDDKNMIDKVYKILKGEMSITDLLEYYNVSLNNETTNTYLNRLDNIHKR